MRRMLNEYEAASGKLINFEKSSVFFTRNMEEERIQEVCQELGKVHRVTQGRYLGLPMVITRSKHQVLGFINERVGSKLQGWKGKLLSPVGKESLLNSVAMALPIYAMSCFKLSKKLGSEIRKMMARFW